MNYESLHLHHFGIHANSPTGAGGCFLGNGSGKVRKNSFQGTVCFSSEREYFRRQRFSLNLLMDKRQSLYL